MIRNIGVLTSGGDSPGMNAAARAVVRTVLYEGGKVFGIYDGYRGLLDEHIEELSSRSVSDILQRGGTFWVQLAASASQLQKAVCRLMRT